MNNTTIKVATDDEIRQYLQGEIQASLQGNGLDWLDTPLEAALDERQDRETVSDRQLETAAEARMLIKQAAMEIDRGEWDAARDSMIEAHSMLTGWLAGRPLTHSRELERYLEIVEEALEGAMLEPGSIDWTTWQSDEYCELMLWQPYYSPWLYNALEAWENGADLTINGDRLEVIEAETESE